MQSRATRFTSPRRRERCHPTPEKAMATHALATLIGGTSTPRTAMAVATNPTRVGKSSCAQFTQSAYSSGGRQRSDCCPETPIDLRRDRDHTGDVGSPEGFTFTVRKNGDVVIRHPRPSRRDAAWSPRRRFRR